MYEFGRLDYNSSFRSKKIRAQKCATALWAVQKSDSDLALTLLTEQWHGANAFMFAV